MDDKSSPNMMADDRGCVPALGIDGQVAVLEGDASVGTVTASLSDYFTLLASGFGTSAHLNSGRKLILTISARL